MRRINGERHLKMRLYLLIMVVECTFARRLPDLYWNSTNPIFRDTQHEPADIDAEKMDSLVIHCPTFNVSTPIEKTEQMIIIYRVSRFGYENCALDETAKVVGRCADPYVPLIIRTVFRQFAALPSGLEYSPGSTYYFISTSDGTEKGIDITAGGLCLSKQLRLRVHIHPSTSKDSVHPIRHHGHHHTYSSSLSRRNDAMSETTIVPPRYWEEFLNKLHSSGSSSISTDRSSKKSQYRSSSNQFREALSLDNTIDNYRKGLEYEREENAVSEALRLGPNFKLFEIHEADDYILMPFSASTRLHPLLTTVLISVIVLRSISL